MPKKMQSANTAKLFVVKKKSRHVLNQIVIKDWHFGKMA